MATDSVYRSSHPDVLAWWAAAEEAHRSFLADCDALRAEYPGFEVLTDRTGDHGKVVIGLANTDGGCASTPPAPEGWRVGHRRDVTYGWVPDKRRKLGREITNRLSAVTFKPERPPGMSSFVIDTESGVWANPGFTHHLGVVWASWSISHERVERTGRPDAKAPVDLGLWQRGKLSDYFAAIEAQEAAQAAVG